MKIYNSSGLDEDRVRQDAALFRSAPAFASVLRDYTSALADFRRDPRVVNKLISHETRFRVINHLLVVHAGKILAGGTGGVTYSEMLELCAQFPDIGLRVLKTMLPLSVLTGFVGVAFSPDDRRVKIYTPSAKLMAVAGARLVPVIVALQTLQPHVPRAALLRDDPMFALRALYRNGCFQREHRSLISDLSEFSVFAGGREGVGQIVYAVMLADMGAAPLPSRSALAKQFGLSKTQVWSVFAEGERLGYFVQAESGTPVATAKLRDQYAEWTALELAYCASVLTAA